MSSAMASSSLRKFSRLPRLFGDEVEFVDLGQTVDEAADLGAEEFVDLLARRARVLDRVVQDCGDDRRVVEPKIGEDRGDFERVRKVRIARGALLRPMGFHGVDIGAVQQVFVDLRIVFTHPLDKFVLPHHSREIRRPRPLFLTRLAFS